MVYRCRNDPQWTVEIVTDGCSPHVHADGGLRAFTALFVVLRHHRTQRVIHRSAP